MTKSIEVSTTMHSTLRNEIRQLVMLHLAWSGMNDVCSVYVDLRVCCPLSLLTTLLTM